MPPPLHDLHLQHGPQGTAYVASGVNRGFLSQEDYERTWGERTCSQQKWETGP